MQSIGIDLPSQPVLLSFYHIFLVIFTVSTNAQFQKKSKEQPGRCWGHGISSSGNTSRMQKFQRLIKKEVELPGMIKERSITQSINAFQGKIQTVQFTNIYIYIYIYIVFLALLHFRTPPIVILMTHHEKTLLKALP